MWDANIEKNLVLLPYRQPIYSQISKNKEIIVLSKSNPPNIENKLELRANSKFTCVAQLHNYILTGDSANTVKLFDSTSLLLIQSQVGHTRQVNSVAFHPNGEQFCSGSDDSTVIIYSLSGEIQKTFLGHTAAVMSVSQTHHGDQIVSGSRDGTVQISDSMVQNNIISLQIYKCSGPVFKVYVGLDFTIFAAQEDGIDVIKFNRVIHTIKDHPGTISSMISCDQGDKLICGYKDGQIVIFDWKTNTKLKQWHAHEGEITTLDLYLT